MADVAHVQQYVNTVTIPREGLAALALSEKLSKNDYRIVLLLLTHLDGFYPYTPTGRSREDPRTLKILILSRWLKNSISPKRR